MDLPRRTFLDTNVVNFVLDHGECIFENATLPSALPAQDLADIDALQLIFSTGQRAHWELAVSPLTYAEILETRDPGRRADLQRWFGEIWAYWRGYFDEDGTLSDAYAEELGRRVSQSSLLLAFPDAHDRELICHAIAYGCDAFCTRDRKSILKRGARAPKLPLELLSPAEWGRRVQRYAGLWL